MKTPKFLLYVVLIAGTSCQKSIDDNSTKKPTLKDISGTYGGMTLKQTKFTAANGLQEKTDPNHTLQITYINENKVRAKINSSIPLLFTSFECTLTDKQEISLDANHFQGTYQYKLGDPASTTFPNTVYQINIAILYAYPNTTITAGAIYLHYPTLFESEIVEASGQKK
jgi:hypothetical protein